jgi:hypothetical protein
MMVQLERALAAGWRGYRRASLRLVGRLQALGWLPMPPQVPEPLEDAVLVALSPVEPSAGFRDQLRHNLSVAARRQREGLLIEYPRPFRARILLGLSAGVVALVVTLLVLVFRSRPSSS